MKKCYLITAYDQPAQLARLVTALQADQICFFIHIDKKFDIVPFRAALTGQKNVKFIEQMKVNWMGYTQVASTLALMREAAKERCDYYTILSHSDYPIKSNQYILDFFSRANTEFISFWKLADHPVWLYKVRYYYAIDIVPLMNYRQAFFPRLYWSTFYKLMRFMRFRRFPAGLEPYGGCGWWSLSHGCLSYVLDFVEKNPAFVRFYQYTHSPTEMFFQTIILNSEWAPRVQNYAAYQEWSRTTSFADKDGGGCMLSEDSFNFRHIDWSPSRCDDPGRPATLDDRDFEALRDSPNLFARKFDEHTSKSLLDRVDRDLRTPT
jgi:hypothetical protein